MFKIPKKFSSACSKSAFKVNSAGKELSESSTIKSDKLISNNSPSFISISFCPVITGASFSFPTKTFNGKVSELEFISSPSFTIIFTNIKPKTFSFGVIILFS